MFQDKWLSRLAIAQGVYFALTGLWPLLHMNSFLWVTGPKTDLWLVRTVSCMIVANGFPVLLAGLRRRLTLEMIWVAVLSAFSLMCIDILYSLNDTIRDVYLLDAVAEAALLLGWAGFLWRRKKWNGNLE